MTHKSGNNTQTSVETLIISFFDKQFTRELQQFRLSFYQPLEDWLTSTRNELLRIKKDENYYKNKIELLNQKIPELQQVVKVRGNKDWYKSLAERINAATIELPEAITENQSDFHLHAQEDDSIPIRTGKFVKRIKSSFTKKPLTRTVYLRQLFIQFIVNQKNWLEQFASKEFQTYSDILDILLRLDQATADAKTAANAENINQQDFSSQIIINLEERILAAVQSMNEIENSNEEYVKSQIEPIQIQLLEIGKIAGTFRFRQKKKEIEKTFITDQLSGKNYKIQEAEWYKYLFSQFNDLKVNVEIATYGLEASNKKNEIKNLTHEFFRDALYLPLGNADKIIKGAREKINGLKDSNKIDRDLDTVRAELNEVFETDILDPMQDQKRMMQPVESIQKAIGDLQAESRHFSETLDLAVKREKSSPVPKVEISTIRWQSQAARFMKEEVIRNLDPNQQEFAKIVNHGKSVVKEALQVADVNLQAAIESLSESKKERSAPDKNHSPKEISLEGLNRASTTLATGIKEIREKQDVYEDIVETLIPKALKKLSGNMLRREFQQLLIQDKALLVKEQALDWKDKVSSKSAILFEKIEIAWRFATKKFREYSRIIKPYLGIRDEDVVTIREKRNLAEYLASSSSDITIPFVYERLFNLEFPIDHRFYVPPRNGVHLVESSYDEWKRGLSTNVIVVGEKGSGKSTLIRFAEEQALSEENTIELTFDKTFIQESELLNQLCKAFGFKHVESVNEFISKVQNRKKRTPVIVENLQNISIRNINGFEAMEAFWVIMTSTMDKVFWIVSCSRYSWEFFVKISEADQYFSHIIYTDRLSESEIKKAIMTRHKSTGYEFYFEPDETIRKSRSYKKLLGDQEKAQELVMKLFFNKLYKVSEGNISIGMIFWLKSIKEIDEHRFVFRPIEVTDIDKLEVPSIDVLFTLATIVQHDVLSIAQIAMALDEDISESRLMLARLKTKGIILETEHGFKLNHLVYRQVVRILKQRNIIH